MAVPGLNPWVKPGGPCQQGKDEFGHLLVGRWFGVKAEIFSVGFGPELFEKPRPGARQCS